VTSWSSSPEVADACAADPPTDAAAGRQALIRRLRTFHASPRQCIEMAARAGAAAVVLTHHLPEADLAIDRRGYDGVVHVGADLDRFVV
jgi:ribonuclease BN (tRNA processing enzyme)